MSDDQERYELGRSPAVHTFRIVRYPTFNTDEQPFAFDTDWPRPEDPVE